MNDGVTDRTGHLAGVRSDALELARHRGQQELVVIADMSLCHISVLVQPEDVPLFVLRVPVRYYRQPPVYFRGWLSNAPPRWGEHWGHGWEQRRSGWDRWNRGFAPAPAPLPVYQRQYSGDRYPRQVEQQQTIRSQNYRYQPHDAIVRQHFQPQQTQKAPAPAQREKQKEAPVRSPKQQDIKRVTPPQQQAPAVQQPKQQRAPRVQDRVESKEPNRGQGQGQMKDEDRGRGNN